MNELNQQTVYLEETIMDTRFYECAVFFGKTTILKNCHFERCLFLQEQTPTLDFPPIDIDSQTHFHDCGYRHYYLVASVLACRARELYEEFVEEIPYIERMSIPFAIYYLPFCWETFLQCEHTQKEWALEVLQQQFVFSSEVPPWEPHPCT